MWAIDHVASGSPCGRWKQSSRTTRRSEQESASLDAFPRVSNNDNYPTLAVTLRTANDSITRVRPLMIMLTPTKVPIAQPELDGHCR